MKKVELLSPAGNMKCLKYAIANGADAVYISGKNFGARKYAENFTKEEIKEAIKYAHIYQVKIYITINTLIEESEKEDFINYVKYIHENNVDAVIMQDIGMIKLIHEIFPNLEIHASTQTHCHNEETIKFLKSLGVSRVVLAREMTIDQIKSIKTDIEKEVFIHGALCVSYSGQCLASSMILNRSGNKGECAGICRLPFDLYKENEKLTKEKKYLLSLKELNTTEYIKQILSTDIKSLKIEGRMKSPEYVGYITKIYRNLIDKENKHLTETEQENIYKLYNREFTKGYLNNETNQNISNIKSPSHQGITIGKVIDIKNNKIKIKLTKELNQNDGIKFTEDKGMIANFIYNEKNLLINQGKKDQIIYLDNKIGLTKKTSVQKTTDIKLIKEINNIEEKQQDISFNVKAKLNEKLKVEIKYKNINISKETNTINKAINKPTTKEEIKEKLNKTNNTPFKVKEITINMDNNIFIPLKEINNIKRELINALIEKLTTPKPIIIKKAKEEKVNQKLTKSINFLVRNEEQLKTLLTKNVNIYTEEYLLYKKYKNNNIYYKTPRVNNNYINLSNENILCSELGAINKYKDNNNIISDIYLNIKNINSINLLIKNNVNKIGLSTELEEKDIEIIMNEYKKSNKTPNLEILIYGKIELMIMKYCPINKLLNENNKTCNLCKQNNYYLEDRNKEKYQLIHKNCLTTLMNYKNINLIKNIKKYQELNINNFRIDLLNETKEEIENILKEINIL